MVLASLYRACRVLQIISLGHPPVVGFKGCQMGKYEEVMKNRKFSGKSLLVFHSCFEFDDYYTDGRQA